MSQIFRKLNWLDKTNQVKEETIEIPEKRPETDLFNRCWSDLIPRTGGRGLEWEEIKKFSFGNDEVRNIFKSIH